MKIIAFNGSPRIKGNTAKIIDAIFEGAAGRNASTEQINLAKWTIKPCIACDQCKKKGSCIHEDDFLTLVEKMKESDVVIFGTPIYWLGPTAQFKSFFDRFYGIYAQGFFKSKYILVVTAFESEDEKMPNHTIGMLKHSMEWIGVKGFESFSVPGVKSPDDVLKRFAVLVKANKLGEELAAKLI